MKYKLTFITLLALAGLLSCTNELKEQTEKPQETKNGLIAFNVKDNKPEDSPKTKAAIPFDGDDELGLKIKESIIPTTFDMTKAAPFSSVSDILSESIGLAIMTADSENASSEAKASFDGSPFTLTYNSSAMRFYPDAELWWPMEGKYMSFYAWLPESVGTLSVSDGNPPVLNVEIEENVSSQIDLMYSTPVEKYDMPTAESDVNLALNHGLTALRFKAETGMVVTSVKVSGVYDEGTFDLSSGTWSNLAADGNEYEITTHTAHAVEDFDVFDDEYTMFLLPQTCPAGSSITVEIDGVTKTASIAGLNLERGILNTFTVGQLPHPERQPLTFTALEDGTFTLTINRYVDNRCVKSVSYSIDNGETWVTTENNSSLVTITTPTITEGNTVLWKGDAVKYVNSIESTSNDNLTSFSSTGNYKVSGNIMSMIYQNDFKDKTTIPSKEGVFMGLFKGSKKLVDASELLLPATTLWKGCYKQLFEGCTSLTSTPELPATTLTSSCYHSMFKDCTSLNETPELPALDFYSNYCTSCYESMFQGCTSLTKMPELPATSLYSYSYKSMFQGCTSLTDIIEELPATKLSDGCYQSMFQGCTSLKQAPKLPATNVDYISTYYQMFQGCRSLIEAPELPATKLGGDCYRSMFQDCTALKTAPVLPATTLMWGCYQSMFQGCRSLNEAPELPAITMQSSCYRYMFDSCTSLTEAPELPATTLANNCYEAMFKSCTALTSVPAELPATSLPTSCYQNMFNKCSALVNAPEIKATSVTEYSCYQMFYGCSRLTTPPSKLYATSLAKNCYDSMFYGCQKLETAPELPATTLANYCYHQMFYGCTLLSTPPVLPATTAADYCYSKMFENSGLTYPPELPATTLANYCYRDMFCGCRKLETTPELPALTLADYCYSDMFMNCTKIIETPELPATDLATGCYSYMFRGCSSLVTAQNLPATTLAASCYAGMFCECSSLVTAPNLPATTLATSCYSEMFAWCRSLTNAPDLPAETMINSCYYQMFSRCSSIVTAPQISATSLDVNCFNGMFYSCSSLKNPPILPVTELVNGCYCSMFQYCTSLEEAPELPAETLAYRCYERMFSACSKLKYVKAAFLSVQTSDNSLTGWLYNVSSTGTFVKNAAATWDITGSSGIPTGWTVETYTP